jgi:integrase/recombinase XerD
MKATFAVVLDTRRVKNNNLYPLKLRVYYNKETRYYTIPDNKGNPIDLSESNFKRSYLAEKPRGKEKDLKEWLTAMRGRAINIANELKRFDFTKFEKRLLNKASSVNDIVSHYKEIMEQLTKQERIKTRKSYENSLNSLQEYLKNKYKKKGQVINDETLLPLYFDDVSVDFLEDYEKWMLSEGNGLTTVGIYLRALRAVFNTAIDAGDVDRDAYPFGKRKYQIPGGRKIKKALAKADLKKLFEYPLLEDGHMKKARDFWFFSYQASGINGKDVAELKEKNIKNGSIIFNRSKTIRTAKSTPKPILVYITPFLQSVIDKYGNKNRHKEDYVFPLYNHSMDAEERERATGIFSRFVNQHIKKLAKLVGVNEDISYIYSRHSFATVAIQQGASKEFVQDQLGHQSLATTENYFKGFEEATRKKIAEKIMDFTEENETK